jgi:hypothetical protein
MTRNAMVAVMLLSLGCATRSAVPRDRSPATVEERLAAHRRSDPKLRTEENEYRFGHERARQKKRQRQTAAPKTPAAGPADVTKSNNPPPQK